MSTSSSAGKTVASTSVSKASEAKPSVLDVVPMTDASTTEKRHGLIRSYPMVYSDAYYPQKPQKVYHIEIPKNLYPSGRDPGQTVIKELVKGYANEIDVAKKPKQRHVNLDKLSTAFKESSFDEQLASMELDSIPLESSIAIQHFSYPHHSTDAKKFFIHFTKLLKYNDMTLVKARLNGMEITDFILDQLCSGLCRNESVQYLMLNNNKITDIGVERLCNALRWHPVIRSIWLGGNQITDIGMRQISILCSRNHNITEINIANKWPNAIWSKQQYELHPHITHIGIDSLAKSILKGTGLTSISLSDQRIRDEGAMMLFEVLQDSQLRALNLSKNELTDRCCLTLQEVLKDSPILQELNLSNNQIGDSGAIDIAAGVAFNSNLSTLDLSNNQIDVRGLFALFKCLEYNCTLESLLTVGNKTKDDRAENLVVSRSRSVFTFSSSLSASVLINPNSGSSSSSSLSSSILYPRSSMLQPRMSWTPQNLFEVRRSLFMNPDEAVKDEHERRQSHVTRSSLIHRAPSSQMISSGSSKRYSSFAEMIKSPFKSEKDSMNLGGSCLASDSAVESHGMKTRMKSIWLGSSSSASSASFDDYAIKEGSREEEHEDDHQDLMLKRRVKKMVHDANKAHHGRMNIQDAIKTAVHIVEQLEEEEENENDDDGDHDHDHDHDEKHDKRHKEKHLSDNVEKRQQRQHHHSNSDSHLKDARHHSANRREHSHDRRGASEEQKITENTPIEDSPKRPTTTTRASVLKQPTIDGAEQSPKKKKQVRLFVEGEDHQDHGDNEEPTEDAPLNHKTTEDDSKPKTGEIAVTQGASLDENEFVEKRSSDQHALIPLARSTSFDPLHLPTSSSGSSTKRGQEPSLLVGSARPNTSGINNSNANPFMLSEEEMKKFFMEDINPKFKQSTDLRSHGSFASSEVSPSKRLSENYGKTLGVPQIKNRGIRPIRTSISNYADSGEHLMYLRVATEDDPENARPYSMIKIALDKRAERERIQKERQSTQYKVAKMEILTQKPKEKPQLAASTRVPEKFWIDWRLRTRGRYPAGIDEAPGATSTRLEPLHIPPPPTAEEIKEGKIDLYQRFDRNDPNAPWNRYLAHKIDPKLSYQRHLGFKQRIYPPGEVLAARRKENLIKQNPDLDDKPKKVELDPKSKKAREKAKKKRLLAAANADHGVSSSSGPLPSLVTSR